MRLKQYLDEAKGMYYLCDKCGKKIKKKTKKCPECGSKEIDTVMDIFSKMK